MTGAVAVTRLFPAAWSRRSRGEQDSRAEPGGLKAVCSQICSAHPSAPQCGAAAEMLAGTSSPGPCGMIVAQGAGGPRAARVGLEGLRNLLISVEIPLRSW